MFTTNFLSPTQTKDLAEVYGTPLFVYSRAVLRSQAEQMLSVPAPFGLTVRYAMKANPHPDILSVLKEQGIKIDASSGYEADLALQNGFAGKDILLTSQQLAHNLKYLVEKGVQFTATSLHQLEVYGGLFPETEVGVRLNPGVGSGHSAKTNVGGIASSFGIWFENMPLISEIADKYRLTITRLHTHIGSGTDPEVWQEALHASLALAELLTDVVSLDMGGGFKVARLDGEHSADMSEIGAALVVELLSFRDKTNRELCLELEPGTFLTANAGVLLARVDDVVDTGKDGYNFIKLDTGLNDILRPSLYGAQHPIEVLNESSTTKEYVVVGHNCESGDLLTPAPGQPEKLGPRMLNVPNIGDLVVIGGVGAYCAGMAAHGYNAFPDAKQITVD